ncbi:hypothetical protein [Vibrio phage vB_VnaS-AQKL99]|nr:hypothetical protein [Vibrio phage vB_VnaS-AQKL99]
MTYATGSFNTRVEMGKKLAELFRTVGVTVKREYESTVNSEPAYTVIIQLASDVFMRYTVQWYKWYDTRYTDYYTDTLWSKMGSAYVEGADDVSGIVSPTLGYGSGSASGSSHPLFPLPGILHVARNVATSEIMFCLENPADQNAACHGVGKMQIQDDTFGYSEQWFFDGDYAYRDVNSRANIPFMYNVDGTGRAKAQSGSMQIRNNAGVVVSYHYLGTRSKSYNPDVWSTFQPLGHEGAYNSIWNKLTFEPSLTSVFLPSIWLAHDALKTSLRTPRGERNSFRICNMLYLGTAQEIVYNSKKWRIFPCRGKPGTNTPGIAFLVGDAT